MDVITKTIGWEFLDEPLWRWFIFIGALLLIMWGWKGVLSFVA